MIKNITQIPKLNPKGELWKMVYPTKESITKFFNELRESFKTDPYWTKYKKKMKIQIEMSQEAFKLFQAFGNKIYCGEAHYYLPFVLKEKQDGVVELIRIEDVPDELKKHLNIIDGK